MVSRTLLHARLATDESLVNLNNAALATERSKRAGAHRFADAVSEKPGRLVGDLKDAVQLVS